MASNRPPSEDIRERVRRVLEEELAPSKHSRTRPLFLGGAATVGYSRVYVGAHYPSDVATGAALGMTFSALVRRTSEWLVG